VQNERVHWVESENRRHLQPAALDILDRQLLHVVYVLTSFRANDFNASSDVVQVIELGVGDTARRKERDEGSGPVRDASCEEK
jgi:hypothetical protein